MQANDLRHILKRVERCFRRVPLLQWRLQGSALYISILVSIVIGIILSLFILAGTYNQRQVTVFSQDAQLYYNLKSAFQMAGSLYFTPERNYTWIKNQVNDDSIRVKKMNWGAYLLIAAETRNRHHTLSQSGLFGTFMSPDTGLMVSDNSRPVGLSGAIIFKSACYLPKAGTRPAYIEGQSYLNSPGNAQFIKSAPAQVPPVDRELLAGLKRQRGQRDLSLDSAVAMLPETCTQPFTKKTLVWETSSTRLANTQLGNNIKIVCGDIEVDSTAHLENILLVCKKARFKKGFRGKVHVIAEDSISMEEGCEFRYPSSFVLLAGEQAVTGLKYIQFNRRCTFYGGILALRETEDPSGALNVFVKLHPESEINGSVYSAGYLHLEGQVNATAIAGKLLLKTASAVYENHILGCEINPGKYARILAIPLVFNRQTRLVCCEKIS